MSKENIDNNTDKRLQPVTVIVKLLRRIRSKNLKNGSQVSPRKYPDEMGVWGLI
jgi:hypothetical protein